MRVACEASWDEIGCKLTQVLPKLAQIVKKIALNKKHWGFEGSKTTPGTKSRGARSHQGGTREAPGRHQGGTKEAPRNDLHIDMGPRAAPYQRLIEEHITVDRSALI